MEQRLEIARSRLLLRVLDAVPETELHAMVIREAGIAAMLAGVTPFPLLLFPCLFEERVSAALEEARRQERLYWHLPLTSNPAQTFQNVPEVRGGQGLGENRVSNQHLPDTLTGAQSSNSAGSCSRHYRAELELCDPPRLSQ